MSVIQEERSFDEPTRLLARVASSYPRVAYPLADWLGALRNRVTRRWPAAAEVNALFPHLDAMDSARVASRVSSLHERNRVLVQCIATRGIDPLRTLVSASESFQSVRGPRILATFHVGAVHAFGPALERLQSPVLAFRDGPIFTPRGALEIQTTKGDEQLRAAALHRALQHLRDGGIVFLAFDDARGDGVEAQCLGRRLRIAGGAFALARWTSAPIQIAAARWIGHRVAIDLGQPLTTPSEAAGWLERYLLETPSEVTLGLLRNLLGVS